MGVMCEINLFTNPDKAYVPGSTIGGVVKYILSEEKLYSKITISLKGLGKLTLSKTIYNGTTTCVHTYVDKKEKYVDIDCVTLDNKKGVYTPAGTHEIPFTFELPEKIPPTFKYKGSVSGHTVYCKISYYVRIKFERPGILDWDKRYKTKINVSSTGSPTLPSSESYSSVKKPFQPFQSKDKVVAINGTVLNSVTAPGGYVKIRYKVNNTTSLDIKHVKIRLTQDITFNCNGHYPDLVKYQKITDCQARPIEAGGEQEMELIVDVPTSVVTMKHSKLVSRDYFIDIVAELPLPHRKAVLRMPVEILENNFGPPNTDVNDIDDAPPSYAEAMQECKKDDFD